MGADFADIELVDLDLRKTTWSRVHTSMRTLYLKLSAEPDLDWIRFFREERESRFVVKRHGLWIEDGFIVFDCLLADVEAHHLPDLRQSVAYANVRSRELRAVRRLQSRQRQDERQKEEQQLESLRAMIRGSETAQRAAKPPPPAPRAAPSPRAAARPTTDTPLIEFDRRRSALRARFRAALKTRKRESDRGKD